MVTHRSAPLLTITYEVTTSGGSLTDTTQTIGLRFQDVQIPQGVTITSATLEFEAANGSESAHLPILSLKVRRVMIRQLSAQQIMTLPVAQRLAIQLTGQTCLPGDSANDKYQSPDITAIVQEITDRGGWCGGQAMSFIITGSGQRTAIAYDNALGDAPVLRVEYDPDSVPSTGGCINQTLIKSVSTGNDDAEERCWRWLC